MEDMASLSLWEYFMNVAGISIYNAYRIIGAAGRWITVIQWLEWLIQVIRRAWRACRGEGINQAHRDPEGFKAEAVALVELMGPGPDRTPEVNRSRKKI